MGVVIYDKTEARRGSIDDIRHLALLLIRRRWLIAAIIALSTISAVVISFIVTPIYVATATLVPADTGEAQTAIASALGQLGGLAELAGLQGPQSHTVVEAIALLKSREFTEDFIRDENLLPVLFSKRWDPVLNKWKVGKRVPDLWDGFRLFDRKIRFVDQDEKTGIVTLRIEWKDPVQAADWANELVRRVNAQMQQRALRETGVTLKYLKRELETTRVAPVQIALQDLIEANLKRQAVASVRPDYVFRVVDPAAPPNRRDKLRPRKLIYLIVGAFFGIVLAMFAVVGTEAVRNVSRWIQADASAG
jgi:uncharacterized protein involved in exopolysaccharide biosynthesis